MDEMAYYVGLSLNLFCFGIGWIACLLYLLATIRLGVSKRWELAIPLGVATAMLVVGVTLMTYSSSLGV